jgi:hypothetical protein
MIRPPLSQPMPHEACSDSTRPLPDASAATATTPGCDQWHSVPPGPSATRGSAVLARSAGRKPALSLARRQAVRTERGAFFECFHGHGSRAQDCQQGQRPQGERHMPIPARPTADLIVLQPDLAFGRLKAALNRPAGPATRTTSANGVSCGPKMT